MIGAGCDRVLVLPRQIAILPVAVEEAHALVNRRPDVKQLLRVDPRHRAAGDVPQVVAAAAGQPEARLLERLEDRRHRSEADVMELNILARGDMTDPCRIGLRNIGDRAHLLGIQTSEGDLDPDHLHAGLALTIDAVLEPEGAKHIGRNLRVQNFGGFLLEGFDLL